MSNQDQNQIGVKIVEALIELSLATNPAARLLQPERSEAEHNQLLESAFAVGAVFIFTNLRIMGHDTGSMVGFCQMALDQSEEQAAAMMAEIAMEQAAQEQEERDRKVDSAKTVPVEVSAVLEEVSGLFGGVK